MYGTDSEQLKATHRHTLKSATSEGLFLDKKKAKLSKITIFQCCTG